MRTVYRAASIRCASQSVETCWRIGREATYSNMRLQFNSFHTNSTVHQDATYKAVKYSYKLSSTPTKQKDTEKKIGTADVSLGNRSEQTKT